MCRRARLILRAEMFEASAAFELFDYFRVPYTRVEEETSAAGLASLAARGQPARLFWWTRGAETSEQTPMKCAFAGAVPLFARLASENFVRSTLRRLGGEWRRSEELRDEHGTLIGAIWRREDGSVFLPFDPGEAISNYWTERYLEQAHATAINRLSVLARRGYYRARPLLPRSLQMRMRRSFSRVQSKARFPRWPIETALHDLYHFLFQLVGGVAERPIPYIGIWPGNYTWSFVLTHDVEAQIGYDKLPELLQVEVELGYRSSWNFVPQNRYVVEDHLVDWLRENKFEVGVHGFHHDGRDLSPSSFKRRLPGMRSYADRWQASGFRSPATLRSAKLMPRLGFDYDSSYTDTAPFEPQAGGCCTWLPYMIEDMVELPITLPQDHTLFDLLGHEEPDIWLEKARFLRDQGGMALVLTHSDYVGNQYLLDGYRQLLKEFADDSTAWKPLPREVSAWWRSRSSTTLEDVDGEWRAVGPAQAEAQVEFFAPHVLSS